MATSKSTAEGFWARVEQIPFHTCWEWTGSFRGKGYGSLDWNGRARGAHAVAWELTYGPIPPGPGHHGTCVLHRCDNPSCVRPDHLFLGTNSDNVRDCIAKGRYVQNSPKRNLTHCPRGHSYSGENAYVSRNGWTQCQICRKTIARARRLAARLARLNRAAEASK